jgi:hypothetical protein
MENEMSNAKHTPTPWWVAQSAGPGILAVDAIDPADGNLFAVCEIFGINDMREHSPEAEANAAFIVRACNCHNQLVAALKALYDAVDSSVELTPEIMRQARAALAAAEAA